jgi:hypothetical protein
MARILVDARHPADEPHDLVPDTSLNHCRTCGEFKGETPEYKRQSEAYERAVAAYKAEVPAGEAAAEELVRGWQEAWRDPATRPTGPPPAKNVDLATSV